MRSPWEKMAAYSAPASDGAWEWQAAAGREKGCLPPAREKPLPPGG